MEAPQVNEKVATLDPVMVEDVDEVLTEEEKSRLVSTNGCHFDTRSDHFD